jgi:hypothetical protein
VVVLVGVARGVTLAAFQRCGRQFSLAIIGFGFVAGPAEVAHRFSHGIFANVLARGARAGVIFVVFPMGYVMRGSLGWPRAGGIMIAAAGLYMEFFLAASRQSFRARSAPGALHTLVRPVITGTVLTLFFNANPLMPSMDTSF